ncbi:hypothetical protein A1O7_07212 [Cladophialophora yegresii CBS 114405]|uniref:Transcription factor domain-containing protein n=1 Tax=Cladophialophora yegresii CBS 114405 TaxID=1182544 RepID=W9VMW8_9EURO|nr:uncharacterized protein A1O7_07212 [Cladophialophora yegresii CBS 114405]EXJ56868.1 hypothetical protein A1O7_07212 [Cladophialophora yegresii CBS 114405]
MAVVDCTAFYLSLANAALFFHQKTINTGSEHSDFEESSKYLSLCLNQVVHRLKQEPENISEGVITTVLGFLCHDCTVGRWDRYAMHMDGLQNILLVRGNFQRLESTVAMFVSWFDVLGSSIFDTKPRFPLPQSSTTSTSHQVPLSTALQQLLLRLSDGSDQDKKIATALENSMQLATFVNENAYNQRFWKDGATAARRITPVMHLLLSLPRPLDFEAPSTVLPEIAMRELVRLALLIMLTRLKKACSLVSDELDTLLERFSLMIRTSTYFDRRFPELSLWATVIVATMEQAEQRRNVYVGAISIFMENMGIYLGEDAIARVKKLVWLDPLMDAGARSLEFELNCAARFLPIAPEASHFNEPVASLRAA